MKRCSFFASQCSAIDVNYRKRFDFANYVRCLADNTWQESDDDGEYADDDEYMDVDKMQLRKPGRNYRNQVIRDL